MKILLASDHAGFEYKQEVKNWLRTLGYEVQDEGNFSLISDDDYPDFIKVVAKQISSDPDNIKGIVFGGSGQGEAIVANRYPNVRAVVYYGSTPEILTLSRDHNDANVLSIGARFVNLDEVKEGIKKWLQTQFSEEERHIRRIKKIDNLIEEEHYF